MVVRALFTGLAGLMLAACQHQSAPAPAMLADANPETMNALKAGLDTLGAATIQSSAIGSDRVSLWVSETIPSMEMTLTSLAKGYLSYASRSSNHISAGSKESDFTFNGETSW